MTWRDNLAKDAPITPEVVAIACGLPLSQIDLKQDGDRAMFFTVWALLAYEWADAMIYEADKVKPV